MSVDVLRGPAAPSIAGYQVRAAGHEWDAVRAPVAVGRIALALLGEHNGAVIEDPREPALYWFVWQGTTTRWDVPGTRPLGMDQHLVVPGRCRTRGPGPWWRIRPDDRWFFTDPIALRGALLTAGGHGQSRRLR